VSSDLNKYLSDDAAIMVAVAVTEGIPERALHKRLYEFAQRSKARSISLPTVRRIVREMEEEAAARLRDLEDDDPPPGHGGAAMSLDGTIKTLEEQGNRGYDPCYMAAGERALVMRALRYLMHAQQQMISEARVKYSKESQRHIFEDHKQHHEKQIEAAGRLFDRFRDGSIRSDPTSTKA
jgi:hypothetical protein